MLYPCWLPTQEALLLLLQDERKDAGKSQKDKAMMFIMKCPVLWMNSVKYFVKRLHVKNIKNKKVFLKIQSISASSFKFKAWGKVFC